MKSIISREDEEKSSALHLLLPSDAVAAAPVADDELEGENSYLSMAASGILGVLIKCALDAALSSEFSTPFSEIPSTMFGCFFMGFLAPVHRAKRTFAASCTSFAAWNHAMVSAAYNGRWPLALCSLIAGLELGYMSYKVGVDAAAILFGTFPSFKQQQQRQLARQSNACLHCLLWAVVLCALALLDVDRNGIWLACALAPPGAWLRHLLSGLNNRARNSSSWLSFAPGTWTTNLIAAGLHTALIFHFYLH